MTFSYSKTASFTIVHARQLASKAAADMHLCAQYYGRPSEQEIREYAEELAQYLNAGYLEEYEFGFRKERQARGELAIQGRFERQPHHGRPSGQGGALCGHHREHRFSII